MRSSGDGLRRIKRIGDPVDFRGRGHELHQALRADRRNHSSSRIAAALRQGDRLQEIGVYVVLLRRRLKERVKVRVERHWRSTGSSGLEERRADRAVSIE